MDYSIKVNKEKTSIIGKARIFDSGQMDTVIILRKREDIWVIDQIGGTSMNPKRAKIIATCILKSIAKSEKI